MTTKRIVEILRHGQPDETATVRGWVRTKREQKSFAFLELNDGSSLASLQIVLEPALPGYEASLARLGTGAAAIVTGTLVPSPGKNQRIEMRATALEVAGEVESQTYPLQKKRHSFEFLRTIAHLRSRTNSLGAVFRVRNACASAIHTFFQSRGFLWVHTPIISTNDCEGAGELFTVTGLDLDELPRDEENRVDFSCDFFGRRAYLTVSGQLQAEVMALTFENVYTFGPTFRAENSNTSRHLAEFWMVEPEMAFCDLGGDMDLAEEFLRYLFKTVLATCPEDLEFFDRRIDNSVLATAENIANNEFERITYTQAIELLARSDRAFEFPVEWGADLQSEHERYLAEDVFKKPTIVTDYPAGIKAFYMRRNDDGKTVAAMDVLAPKIGEIIGGAQREERLDVLERAIAATDMPAEDLWWYLDLRRYGSVPHAGFGLGFERLVQFMTGMGNIRDVIPFPRTPDSAEF